MKALVTGATGFIGSHLCEELIKRGYEVTCLLRECSSSQWVESLKLTPFIGDCTQPETLSRISNDFDYIFHLAGLTKACSMKDFFDVNVRGTENLMHVASRNSNLRRFIYLSSLSATGPGKNGAPVNEDSKPKPVSHYGESKLAGERAVLKHHDKVPVTILRPPAVYGPRDRDFLVFFKMIKKGFYPDWGKCYYSLLYVDDLVQGILLSAEKEKAEGEIYFLSGTEFYKGTEIAEAISSVLNVEVRQLRIPKFVMPLFAYIGERVNRHGIINRDKVRELRYSHWICDARKAREEIGFQTRATLKDGVQWTADWYRIHRWI